LGSNLVLLETKYSRKRAADLQAEPGHVQLGLLE
jgi:hypothetical protein